MLQAKYVSEPKSEPHNKPLSIIYSEVKPACGSFFCGAADNIEIDMLRKSRINDDDTSCTTLVSGEFDFLNLVHQGIAGESKAIMRALKATPSLLKGSSNLRTKREKVLLRKALSDLFFF